MPIPEEVACIDYAEDTGEIDEDPRHPHIVDQHCGVAVARVQTADALARLIRAPIVDTPTTAERRRRKRRRFDKMEPRPKGRHRSFLPRSQPLHPIIQQLRRYPAGQQLLTERLNPRRISLRCRVRDHRCDDQKARRCVHPVAMTGLAAAKGPRLGCDWGRKFQLVNHQFDPAEPRSDAVGTYATPPKSGVSTRIQRARFHRARQGGDHMGIIEPE
jgi:hypothetical protein